MSQGDRVRIHYLRLPDHEEIFDQRIVLERADVIVTLTDPLALPGPMTVGGRVILETGSRVVWFTFPGRWHDIGRFHRADGTFAGFYANILTPVVIEGPTWHTTDLFLDVWMPPDGPARILDEDELDEALALGHVDEEIGGRARQEADAVLAAAHGDEWPPPIVQKWTLERAVRTEAPTS